MKVEITKSIDIADSAPSLPIVKVVKDEIRDDLSDHVAKRLIELECAKEIVKEPVKEDDNSNTSDDNQSNTDTDNTDDQNNNQSDGANSDDKEDEVTAESLKAELEDIALKEMDGPMDSDQKAKTALEVIGKERYEFDVDKRMSVENIISAIVEAAFKAE